MHPFLTISYFRILIQRLNDSMALTAFEGRTLFEFCISPSIQFNVRDSMFLFEHERTVTF